MEIFLQDGDKVIYKGFIYELWTILEDKAILINNPKIKPIFFAVDTKDIIKFIKDKKWN